MRIPSIFLLGEATVPYVKRPKNGLLDRKSSSCFPCSSQKFPDRCIFIPPELVSLSSFLQEHPSLKKNRFAFGDSPREPFSKHNCNKKRFCLADSTFKEAPTVILKLLVDPEMEVKRSRSESLCSWNSETFFGSVVDSVAFRTAGKNIRT